LPAAGGSGTLGLVVDNSEGVMSAFPPTPFWDFSLAVYGRPGVAPACLALQQRHGADVNLLLFCAWFGAAGHGRLTADDFDALDRLVADWHQGVVRHLRALRVELRGGRPPLPGDLVAEVRRRVQKVELDAEHAEQVVLAAWAEDRGRTTEDDDAALADAAANMLAYVAILTPRPDDADRADLDAVLAGCAAWLED
jgi:uncharacterized protein (TIGR02444 family)